MAKDSENPIEEKGEAPAIEQAEDATNKPKTTKAAIVHHKAGCGAVGHAGKCPVGPQEPIGVR